MLSNSGHDERGRYSGGQAGDQGGEWTIVPWYLYPYGGWDYVLRHSDPKVRQVIANLAIEGANNDNIGYDQNERYTFLTLLVESGFHPANIKTPCESDCSAGVLAIIYAAAQLTRNALLLRISPYGYTGNMIGNLTNAGFELIRDPSYLNGESRLIPGDILLNVENHTCIEVGDGKIKETDVKPVDWKATGTAICTEDDVNLRIVPAGEVLGTINKGQRFEIDGKTDRGWTHANVAGIGVCWIFSDYVEIDKPWKAKGTAIIVPGVDASDPVNVRATPNGAIIGSLISGQRFEIDGQIKNGWYHVKVAGIGIGYIYGAWIKLDK